MRSTFLMVLLCSTAQADILAFRLPERWITTTTEHAGETEWRSESAPLLGDWTIDAATGLDSAARNYSRAWQTSRMSLDEIFIEGGVLTSGPAGVSFATSAVHVDFLILGRPALAHLVGQMAFDPRVSPSTWNGGVGIYLNPSGTYVSASTIGDERFDFNPASAFVVGADGIARASIDQWFALEPWGSYEFFARASSNCPNHAPGFCDGRPVEFTAHLMVVPEPATALLAGLAIAAFVLWVRRCHLTASRHATLRA